MIDHEIIFDIKSLMMGGMGSNMFYIFDSKIYSSAEQAEIKIIEIEIQRLVTQITKKYC